MSLELGNIEKIISTATKDLQINSFDTDTYLNSVFTSNINQPENGKNQPEKIRISIKKIISSIVDFGIKHEAKAQKDVKKDIKAISKNEKEAIKKNNEINEILKNFVTSIETNTDNIMNAISEIEDLTKNNEIANEQEKIAKELEKIEAEKANLNSNNPETRNAAINAIQASSEIINALAKNITTIISSIETDIEEQNEIVTNNVEVISSVIQDSATKISEGITDIQKYIQNGKKLTQDVTLNTIKGTKDAAIATGEISSSEAASINPITASLSKKVLQDGISREKGSTTRITESTANLGALIKQIGTMGTNCSEIASFTTSIGSLGEGVISLTELYKQTTSPLIESIGTLNVEEIENANIEFQEQVSKLVTPEEKNNTNNKNNTKINNSKNKDTKNGQTATNNINSTVELDTTKIRKAFGI